MSILGIIRDFGAVAALDLAHVPLAGPQVRQLHERGPHEAGNQIFEIIARGLRRAAHAGFRLQLLRNA